MHRKKMTELKTKWKDKFQFYSTSRPFKVIAENTEATSKGQSGVTIVFVYCVCFLSGGMNSS